MLDPKFMMENLDKIKTASQNKGFFFDTALFEATYTQRQKCLTLTESLRHKRNAGSEAVRTCKDPEARVKAIQEVQNINKELQNSETQLRELENTLQNLLLTVPNVPTTDTPIGSNDKDNQELYCIGTKPTFHFPFKNHMDIVQEMGLADFSRATSISGSRSYVLMGMGALLERALFSLAIDVLVGRGFQFMSVPTLVKPQALQGSGYLPQGAEEAYHVERDDLWLVGTAEVSLASFYSGQTLSDKDLPIKICAHSACFRREAGAHGKDTKGFYRVHQFQKLEQVILCPPNLDISEQLHGELLKNAEDLLQMLELPYRVLQACTGDLGLGQVKKNEVESWMPSRDSYGETHSCSSFFDFQCRRLNIRFKSDGPQSAASVHGLKPSSGDLSGNLNRGYCFSLNNTALASPRILIPFLEIHQTDTGNVRIPKALRPYLGDKETLFSIYS